jgi:hypothetical protein
MANSLYIQSIYESANAEMSRFAGVIGSAFDVSIIE